MKTSQTIVFTVSVIVLTLNAARADWQFDAETGALYDSNLSNSDRAREVKDDWAWHSQIGAASAFQLTHDLRLNLGADLRGEAWARFYAFDNVAPGGSAALRYRFGLGRLAPWILVEDHVGYAFFNEDDRSGFDNKFQTRAGMGITDRASIEAAYTFDEFEAKDRFWDVSGHSGSIRFAFDATSWLQLSVGYAYRNGVVISYALPPRPDIFALAPDARPVESFGSPPYTAYRLRGSTNAVSVSVAYIFSKYFSALVSYEFQDTSHGSLEYVSHLVEAKLAFAY